MTKARLNRMAAELKQAPPSPKKKAPADMPVNPERGQRGDFLKCTVTLPAEMLGALQALGLERRMAGLKHGTVSELVREALADFLARQK